MNEDWKAVFDAEQAHWWYALRGAIARWHEGEVAALQAQFAALRQGVYDIEDAMSRFRPADPPPEPKPAPAPVLPICGRCGRPMLVGTNVGYRVQPDGTITPKHWYSCPVTP